MEASNIHNRQGDESIVESSGLTKKCQNGIRAISVPCRAPLNL